MTTGASLDGLFQVLARGRAPTLLRSEWVARLGGGTTDALVRAGVLVARAPADWHPCGGASGDGCFRRVVASNGGDGCVAVCGRENGGCLDVVLRAEDREVLALAFDGLVRQVRRALGLVGAIDTSDAGFPSARRVGERLGRSVYVALAPHWPGFDAWLAARGDAQVLVPSLAALPAATRERYRGGSPVEVVALAEVLRLGPSGLVGALPEPGVTVRDSGGVAAAYGTTVASAPMCVVIDNEGERALTRPEYEALVARAAELDLFIDMTVTAEGGGHPAWSRDEAGKSRRETLTIHEAASLAELVRTRRALRERDFKTVSVNAIAKVVERARKKVDVQLGRYEWRAFHTLRGETPEAKRWQFNPKGGFAVCLTAAD